MASSDDVEAAANSVVTELVAPLESDHADDDASVSIKAATQSAVQCEDVGIVRAAGREERRKRSSSYHHTEPFKQVVDDSTGLEFDVRACKYCDAVFSFKGGTTSAALRHLKSAHPREFFEGSARLSKRTNAADDTEDEDNGGILLDDTSEEVEGGDAQSTRRSKKKRRRYEGRRGGATSTPRMTVNQLAVSHFLAHHKDALEPSKRLAFVKHLSYNDREAAMYNVLDEELQLELIAQFHSEKAGNSPTKG